MGGASEVSKIEVSNFSASLNLNHSLENNAMIVILFFLGTET